MQNKEQSKSTDFDEVIMISEKSLKRRGWREKLWNRLTTSSILKELDKYIDPNKTVIDVGGNSGYHCRYFAEHAKNVVTYEPVKELHEVQKQNIGQFGLTNVDFRNAAVSKDEGELTLFIDTRRLSMTSQVPLVESEERKVPMVSLDGEGHKDVGFIKIDVEGFEMDVVYGAKNLIENERPNVMVEIYKPWAEKTGNGVDNYFIWFMQRDFKCYYYDCEQNRMIEVAGIVGGVNAVDKLHHLHDGDFLFVGK